jgi:predicted house-cleaning noncanonical NTP pyrophosphatase (MazG superfamily)
MAKTKRFLFNKLIRDKVPENFLSEGGTVHKRVMEHDEFIRSLKEKLLEEAREVEGACNAEEMTEELADILEVVLTLAHEYGIMMDSVEEKRSHKNAAKGGFRERYYGEFLDLEEDSPVFEYFQSQPLKYPHVSVQNFLEPQSSQSPQR